MVVNLRRVYFSDYYQSGTPGPRAATLGDVDASNVPLPAVRNQLCFPHPHAGDVAFLA
jgi:hypothetical protein